MRKTFTLITLTLILLSSCSKIYDGDIYSKNIINGHYLIDETYDYEYYYVTETYNQTYTDHKGRTKTRPATRSVRKSRYIGSTYKEIFVYPSYVIEVRGWSKKEKEIFETIYVTKDEYSNMNIKDEIKLRNKSDKWFKFDEELYSFTPIRKKVFTGRATYLNKRWKSSNQKDFNEIVLPEWIVERENDVYPIR